MPMYYHVGANSRTLKLQFYINITNINNSTEMLLEHKENADMNSMLSEACGSTVLPSKQHLLKSRREACVLHEHIWRLT